MRRITRLSSPHYGLLCALLMVPIVWLRFQAQATTLCLNTRPFSAQTMFEQQPCSWSRLGQLLAGLGAETLKTQVLPDLLFWTLGLWLAARAVPRWRLPTWIVWPIGLSLILGAQFLALHRFPISGDETSYLLQAKLLGQGKLKGGSRGALDRHFEAPSVIRQGGVRSKYQVGWPALLASGGMLANPLFGLCCLILTYRLAQRLGLEPAAAAMSTGSLSLSAFFVYNCASTSIHPGCLFFSLLFLWGWQCQLERLHWPGLMLACLAILCLTNIRLVELPLLVAMAILWPPRRLQAWLWLTLSLVLSLALLGWTNQQQNGDPWLLGFSVYDPEDRWGFGIRGHDLRRAIWNQSYYFVRYLAWMPAGWLVLVWAGLNSPPRLRRLALAALIPWAFYAGHYSLGLVEYGPRYWFVPGLLVSLCAGAGALRLSRILQDRFPQANWLGGLIFLSVLQACLQLGGVGLSCYEQIEPSRLQYERIDNFLSQGPPSLVLLQPGGGARCRDWVRFDSPELNDYVVFAYFLDPPSNARLVKAFASHQPLIMTQGLDANRQLNAELQPYKEPALATEAAEQWVRAGENYLSEWMDYDAAAGCFERALELEPANLYAHSYLEQVESRRGHWARALEHGRMVVAGAPDNFKARLQLALDLERAGQMAEAHREMSRVAQAKAPESEQAREWLEQHSATR